MNGRRLLVLFLFVTMFNFLWAAVISHDFHGDGVVWTLASGITLFVVWVLRRWLTTST